MSIRETVILSNRSASFFAVKTQKITTKHLILCYTINKMMGKTLTTTQQAWGLPWELGVLGGETKRGENGKIKSEIY